MHNRKHRSCHLVNTWYICSTALQFIMECYYISPFWEPNSVSHNWIKFYFPYSSWHRYSRTGPHQKKLRDHDWAQVLCLKTQGWVEITLGDCSEKEHLMTLCYSFIKIQLKMWLIQNCSFNSILKILAISDVGDLYVLYHSYFIQIRRWTYVKLNTKIGPQQCT